MSMSGEELTEGGHPLALIVLSITLTKHLTRSSLRLTPGCVRSLEGDCCVGGADLSPPVQAATPACMAGGQHQRGRSSSPWGDALQGPQRCSVELAHSFASPSPCVAAGALFFQTLLSFFPFVCFFFECPTLLTYDSTGV